MSKKQQAVATMEVNSEAVETVEANATPKAIRTAIVGNGEGLQFTFGTGTEAVLLTSMLSAEVLQQATLHGLRQKVQDAAAIARNPDTGRSATFEDKEQAAMEVFNRLVAGHWNKPAGEAREDGGGMLLRALQELQPKASMESLRAKIAGWTKEEKAAVRLNPKVKTILDRMALEKPAVAAIDSDGLLAGL